MRHLFAVIALPLALALWGASVWWGLPWAVSLRLEPRPLPAPVGALDPAPRRLLSAEVTATYPRLEGLALGDAVQFDRYGLLPPTRGSIRCAVLAPWSLPVSITPIGGDPHAGAVRLSVESTAAGCPDPASRE